MHRSASARSQQEELDFENLSYVDTVSSAQLERLRQQKLENPPSNIATAGRVENLLPQVQSVVRPSGELAIAVHAQPQKCIVPDYHWTTAFDGAARLHVRVLPTGQVANVKVLVSTGIADLDAAIVLATKDQVFTPCLSGGGIHVECEIEIEVILKMHFEAPNVIVKSSVEVKQSHL